jgi:hypothetical protein
MLSLPNVSEIPGGYSFIYGDPEPTVFVWLRRVNESRGSIYAEISLDMGTTDYQPLTSIKVNLSSKRGRDDLVKQIQSLKYPEGIPWFELIEQVCGMTIDRYRVGDPGSIIEVNSEEEVEPPTYFLEPYVMAGVPNVLFGDKGSQKTTTALLIGACLSLPWTDNPLGFSVNSHNKKVVFLDWESERELVRYTILRLSRGMGIPYFQFDYRRCRIPLADDAEQISNYLLKVKGDLVIIDSLGQAAGGDTYKPESALRFFEALRSLKITSLIIAQNAKGEESNKKTIFGSTYFQYYARNIFEIKHSVINQDETSIAVFHRWANYSKQYDPLGLHFSFTPKSIIVENEPVSYEEFRDRVSLGTNILEILKEGKKSQGELKELTDASYPALGMALKRLFKQGKVIKMGKEWGLLVKEV